MSVGRTGQYGGVVGRVIYEDALVGTGIGTPVFITSDNPVTILYPSLTFRGLNDPETSVNFPLSPTWVLCMDHRHAEPASQHYPLRSGPGSLNTLIWRNAIEHMFTHRHPNIVGAEMVSEAERTEFA